MLTLAQPDLKQPPPPLPSDPAALKCGWERPSEVAREVGVLANRFAAELGEPPFEPDWSRIFALERAGDAILWVARTTDGVMAGYLGITLNRGLFTSTVYARIESGYLTPEWRDGARGFKFIRSGVVALRERGGYAIEWETHDKYEPDANGRSRLARLLERLGFEQVGTVMRLR